MYFESTFSVLASTNASNDDWPMFHHDPAHTGATNSSAPTNKHAVVWSLGPKDQNLPGSPAVVDGVVYVSGTSLYAFNASTGETMWVASNEGYSSPVIVNGIAYTGALNGGAFNASTGAEIWKTAVKGYGGVTKVLAVADGYFYSVNEEGFLVGRNASTGALLWTSDGSAFSSPAVANGCLYFGTLGSVKALNAYNGSKLWEYYPASSVSSSPTVSLGYVYVGSEDHNLYCLNASTGENVWNYTTEGVVYSSPTIANGLVYVGSDDGNLYAFNTSTGYKIWNYTTYSVVNGYGVKSSPAIADGVVYVGSDDGNLYAFNASTGMKLWNYSVQSTLSKYGGPQYLFSSPAIANGRIYISSLDHFMVVLETEPNTNTPAPSPTTVLIDVLPTFLSLVVVTLSLIVIIIVLKIKQKKNLPNLKFKLVFFHN